MTAPLSSRTPFTTRASGLPRPDDGHGPSVMSGPLDGLIDLLAILTGRLPPNR